MIPTTSSPSSRSSPDPLRAESRGNRLSSEKNRYTPALGYDFLTSLYDPVVRLTTRERTFKRALIKQADICGNHRVLDLGSGTGTLTLWIKEAHPDAQVTGVDGDPKIIGIAKRKALGAGINVSFDRALASALPYPDETFDRVLSSLFFHHLSRDQKSAALAEAFRVLKQDGELHVADWGKPANPLMRSLFMSIRLLDGFDNTAANARGELPELFLSAGFRKAATRCAFPTVFGTLALYSAIKSG